VSRVLYTEHVAKRDRECDGCRELIPAGTRYVRCSLPPWTEENESDHWWTMCCHGRTLAACPGTYARPGDPEADPNYSEPDSGPDVPIGSLA
jgi:hypothetical protein